jgi:hypothetical protein
MTEGIVSIHGKDYKTVAYRVNEFRKEYPDFTIQTDLVEANDVLVIVKASIFNTESRLLATGYAEEVRAASKINRTSALENAETSAIGRALSALGLGGSQYASADELVNALQQQNDTSKEVLDEWTSYMEVVRDNFDWVMYAKEAIANQDWQSLAGIWGDISHETMAILFRAPTKGGIFTTDERNACKGNDAFNQARKELAA